MMMKRLRPLLMTLFVGILLLIGLLLDLSSRGLVWQFAWSVTGEESVVGQLRGLGEWTSSQFRPRPQTRPLVPIAHTQVNPYGINTFLEQEPDPAKVEAKVGMIADAGFAWIRQQFIWEDIEIHGKGDFEDRRNVDTIGVVSSWAKYDRIVDLAEQHGLQIQARLDNPPAWSRSQPVEVTGAFAPPDDLQDFVDFAVAVAERYQGRIRYYQVWNEPNIYPEWGNNAINPEAYTELLCRTYDALKAVDPEIVVITGALAPTQAITQRDLNDFLFLQRMYDAGAADCFDIISVQGYGLNSGPTDRRMRSSVTNIGRNLYIRDIMVANGDANKPIWISEAAWNFVPSAADAPNIREPRTMFGQVTPQQAADYMPLLYERAQKEWPWVGVVNYWFFSRRDDSERDQPFYYFRMVEPDFTPQADPPFTPLPVYDSMRDHIATLTPTLYLGVHQVDGHWAIQADEAARAVTSAGAQFGTALQADELRFTVGGTDLSLRWQGGPLRLSIDGREQTLDAPLAAPAWNTAHVHLSALPSTRQVIVIPAEDPVIVDSVTVMDRSAQHMTPILAGLAVSFVMLCVVAADVWTLRRAGRKAEDAA